MKDYKFGVIGAGNGGQSMAGELILKNRNFSGIYDCNPEPIAAINKQGGIRMSGSVLSGFAPLSCATTNIKEIVELSDVLLVFIPTTEYEALANQIGPYLNGKEITILLSGYIGGPIVFRKILDIYPNTKQVLLAQAVTIPFTTRLVGPAEVGIKIRKSKLPVAGFPGKITKEVISILKQAIPELIPWDEVLTVGLNDPSPMVHVPRYLFNLGGVESPKAYVIDITDDIWGSPTINKVELKLEEERLSIIRGMGLKAMSLKEFQSLCYEGMNLNYKPVKQKDNIPPTSSQIPERFLTEDVPMSLVPLSSFGKKLGVLTPTTDLLIDIVSYLKGTDYRKTGNTLDYLGLQNMSIENIVNFVKTGVVES